MTARSLLASSRMLGAVVAATFVCHSGYGQGTSSGEAEQRAAYQAIRPEAERCAGSAACFADHVRPYGPWIVALGGRQGEANPEFAGQVTNFAFGVVGGMAGVDPSNVSDSFFCGNDCMRSRLAALARDAKKFAPIAKAFADSGLDLVALWPDDRVRANDYVIASGIATYPGRTPTLGLFQGWTRGETVVHGRVPIAVAMQIASMLRSAKLAAVVRDDDGGVRLVHGDSLAENEAGVLFADTGPRLGIRHRDGSRYSITQRVSPGVYVYLRV